MIELLGLVLIGGVCLFLVGVALAILAAFVLFCRNAWCTVARAWRAIGEGRE
jgi:hypothetical protein